MILVQNVHVAFKNKEVLKGISFEIEPGRIGGYLGPNGAGKTTTMRLLTGTLRPDSGSVFVAGVDVVRDPLAMKRQLGYVPENGLLYESFTPREYLGFVGRMYDVPEALIDRRSFALMSFWGLEDHLDQKMVAFSKGMKQKVLIAAGVLHDPQVLLLDEPMNGLDAQAVLQFRAFLRMWADRGKTILYSSHILDAVEKIADHVVVLRDGLIATAGAPSDLMAQTASDSLEMAFNNLTSTEDIQAKLDVLVGDAYPMALPVR